MSYAKVLEIIRQNVTAVPGSTFSLIDPGGMQWHGRCLTLDYGPQDYYAVIGEVTSGPAEWVGLRIIISGQAEKLSLKPLSGESKISDSFLQAAAPECLE